MAVLRFEPFRDPFDRLMSLAATGTRTPLGMPIDIYRSDDGTYHVETDRAGAPGRAACRADGALRRCRGGVSRDGSLSAHRSAAVRA